MTQHRSNGNSSRTTSSTLQSTAHTLILCHPIIQRSKSVIRKLFQPLDPLFIRILIGGFTVYSLWLIGAILYRYLLPHTYVIVAGQPDGESYILSLALKKVVENHFPNIHIEVVVTDGTDENLAVLEGDLTNQKVTKETRQALEKAGADHAHLATAQADIVADNIVKFSESPGQKVATLSQDTFQLLVQGNFQDFVTFMKQHSTRKNQAIIKVPLKGGQRDSFNKIAEQYDFKEGENYCFKDDDGNEEPPCHNKNSENEAIFRVRILGNPDIAEKLKSDKGKWQILPIEEAEAMKLKHPAFQNDVPIPQGTYQGDPPIPSRTINTIAVQRLLLTRQDMPDWLIYEITVIVNQHHRDLAEALKEIAENNQKIPEKQYIKNYVIPVVLNIPNLNQSPELNSTGITLHPGAEKFYSPEKSWDTWLAKNISNISSALSVVLLIISGLWALNLRFKKERKDKADKYIQEVALLMGFSSEHSTSQTNNLESLEDKEFKEKLDRKVQEYQQKLGNIQFKNLSSNNGELVKQLVKGVCSLEQLSEVFEEARKSLDQEEISQEAFRTFNEAYKTATEFIERKNEGKQREISSYYVNEVMHLLPKNQLSNSSQDLLTLNQIRNEAAEILTKDYIFSRESFRTFIEAYNLVRDAIERSK